MTEKITAADAIRLLDAHEATAVDVREPDEFAVGHIPGAKLLPLSQVLSRAAEVLPDKDAMWLIYCRTGRRSADAVQKLESLGYTNLRDLGGILSWPYEIEGDFEGHFKQEGQAGLPSPSRLTPCHLSQSERPWQSGQLFGFAKGSPFGRAVTEGD